jgi:hypothetical protein
VSEANGNGEIAMLSRGRVAGVVWSVVAVALSAGCATPHGGVSWTATSGGAPCASGRASVRDGLVVLGGDRTGPDFCMPYSLESRDGRMKAVFETSFKARQTSAMIDLQRRLELATAAAQAPTRP